MTETHEKLAAFEAGKEQAFAGRAPRYDAPWPEFQEYYRGYSQAMEVLKETDLIEIKATFRVPKNETGKLVNRVLPPYGVKNRLELLFEEENIPYYGLKVDSEYVEK